MNIEFPDEVLRQANMNAIRLKSELALFLYERNIFTLGQASKFADMEQHDFQKLLSANKIEAHYTKADFEKDTEIIKSLYP